MNTAKRLPSFDYCFCCGEKNPHGLQASFFEHNGTVFAHYTPPKDYCGYPGILHGGITATLADEVMTWAATASEKRFYYALEVKVRYKAPVPTEQPITVSAKVTGKKKKLLITEAVITDKDNTVLAKAEGTYYPLSEQEDTTIRTTMKRYEQGLTL